MNWTALAQPLNNHKTEILQTNCVDYRDSLSVPSHGLLQAKVNYQSQLRISNIPAYSLPQLFHQQEQQPRS